MSEHDEQQPIPKDDLTDAPDTLNSAEPADDYSELDTALDPVEAQINAVDDDSPASDISYDDVLGSGGDLDIEAALASVSSLSDAIAEQEAAEAAEQARIEAEQRQREQERAQRAAYYFPRPPLSRLQRGQITSVLPAFTLILLGAGLAVALSTGDVTVDGPTLLLAGLTWAGVIMVLQWLVSARWAGGSLFAGSAILLAIATLIALNSTEDPGADGWPLLLTAVGVAALVSALFSQPVSRHQWFVGVMLMLMGVIGALYTTGRLEALPDATISLMTFAALALVLLLLIAPLLARRQG